mmetsp:Transcript_535/g.1834  ORF Transcript_535/g.1834 Transcript_535/m.1834 type:complete len:241 (-) Transcript_535:380-1102(-)
MLHVPVFHVDGEHRFRDVRLRGPVTTVYVLDDGNIAGGRYGACGPPAARGAVRRSSQRATTVPGDLVLSLFQGRMAAYGVHLYLQHDADRKCGVDPVSVHCAQVHPCNDQFAERRLLRTFVRRDMDLQDLYDEVELEVGLRPHFTRQQRVLPPSDRAHIPMEHAHRHFRLPLCPGGRCAGGAHRRHAVSADHDSHGPALSSGLRRSVLCTFHVSEQLCPQRCQLALNAHARNLGREQKGL